MAKPSREGRTPAQLNRGTRGRRRAVEGGEVSEDTDLLRSARHDPMTLMGVGYFTTTGKPMSDLKKAEVRENMVRMYRQSFMFQDLTKALDELHGVAHNAPAGQAPAGVSVIKIAVSEIERLKAMLLTNGINPATGGLLNQNPEHAPPKSRGRTRAKKNETRTRPIVSVGFGQGPRAIPITRTSDPRAPQPGDMPVTPERTRTTRRNQFQRLVMDVDGNLRWRTHANVPRDMYGQPMPRRRNYNELGQLDTDTGDIPRFTRGDVVRTMGSDIPTAMISLRGHPGYVVNTVPDDARRVEVYWPHVHQTYSVRIHLLNRTGSIPSDSLQAIIDTAALRTTRAHRRVRVD